MRKKTKFVAVSAALILCVSYGCAGEKSRRFEMEGARAKLDALFVISFRKDEIPAGSHVNDIKTSIVSTAIHRLKSLGVKGVDMVSAEPDSLSLRISTVSVFGKDDVAQLLGRRGKLSFHLVHPDSARLVESLLRAPDEFGLPEGYEQYETFVKIGTETEKEWLIVKSRPETLSDQDLAESVAIMDYFGNYSVSLTFTAEGAKSFHKITADNIGRRLAIVIDGKVHSAPVIKTAISGGRAEISGNFSAKESKLLAVVLKSGHYPVPVQVVVQQ